MNKNKLKKAHDRVFGKFQEHTINTSPRIGETFYTCTNAKLHENESIAEDEWWRFIYIGTDKKVIKIKALRDFLKNDKPEFSHSDILELPLNDDKQALFEPRFTTEIRKTFLITIVDEFGHIEITIKEKSI